MSVKGVLKFNSIAVSELNADFMKATIVLKAVAAFVDSETGETHGWSRGDGTVWSKDTLKKLQELRSAMERDLGRIHFTEDSVASNGEDKKPGLNFPKGIGEHLGSEAPSV